MGKLYKTIDLFAGIGGIRKGFELTKRCVNVLSAENDELACKTYEHLFGEDPYNDVTKEEFKQKVISNNYDILLAGFPCQAFSIAGKKEGFRDATRGTLFFDVADILERSRPKAFLLENVEGLIRHDHGRTFRIILETLFLDLNYFVVGVDRSLISSEIIYNPKEFILNSKYFRVPQNRPRVYFIGFDATRYNGLLNELPLRKLPQKSSKNPLYNNLNDLLEFNADPEFYLAEGYVTSLKKHRDRHKEKGNGFGYIVVNSPELKSPISNAILATGGSGRERNLVFDPQNKVIGMSLKRKKSPLNNECLRYMTPREWGKLQGFINYGFMKDGKDLFSFPKQISRIQQYKQFGNSVTITVIEELANKIIETLDYLEEKYK